MRRKVFRIALALVLVGFGWVAGRAQTSTPDFEILVNAPGGKTTIDCVRGCQIKWVERGVIAESAATGRFEYACSGDRCSSGKVGGWIQR